MLDTIKKDSSAKILIFIMGVLSLWWLTLRSIGLPNDSTQNQFFAATYGLLGLMGGVWGLLIAKKWGGFNSVIGKSLSFFSIGLLFQEIGQIIYSAYIYFLKIAVPYPSVGDLFFYGTIPLYIIAIIYLAQASGVRISLKSLLSKMQVVFVPLCILLVSYFVFLQGYEFDWANPLKVFLDFAVPLGQAIYISLALLTYTLTKGVLGGVMKMKVLFILLALLMQYAADWTFLSQASRGTWYAGGVNDYMYLCAYFLMSFGLLQFRVVYNRLNEENK